MSDRRKFLKNFGATAALVTTGSLKSFAEMEMEERRIIQWNRTYSANDKVRLAGIGMGIQGFNDVNSALQVPGTELVACCDLYTGRLDRAKEVYGNHIFVTKRYEEILDRKDVDAVIIATSDNWHSRICVDALKKGKAVYCEKPMVHRIEEGWQVINAQKSSGKAFQVGSQRVSSLGFKKAKELYESGVIGEINCVEAVNNRQSPLGAWQYTIPLDASEATVDWARYQQWQSKKQPFDVNRFFRWRNYQEYGTGMAGDLYVHLLSGLHLITGSKGPSQIFSLGNLSYWKDGRNVPDVMNSVLEYPGSDEHPAFQVSLRANFASGEGETGYTRIIGTDGVMQVNEDKVTIKRRKMPKAPGIGGWDSLQTYPEAMQKKLMAAHKEKYKAEDQRAVTQPDIVYVAPEEYNDHVAHFSNFIESVRSGSPVVEDAVFGFRAAAPCLACNDSYFEKKVVHWDGDKMQLKA